MQRSVERAIARGGPLQRRLMGPRGRGEIGGMHLVRVSVRIRVRVRVRVRG